MPGTASCPDVVVVILVPSQAAACDKYILWSKKKLVTEIVGHLWHEKNLKKELLKKTEQICQWELSKKNFLFFWKSP